MKMRVVNFPSKLFFIDFYKQIANFFPDFDLQYSWRLDMSLAPVGVIIRSIVSLFCNLKQKQKYENCEDEFLSCFMSNSSIALFR